MKIAHLILAHKNPGQLHRMIAALDHPAFDFYIHLDKKVDKAPFEFLQKKGNVFFITNRVKVYWGTYSVIQATLNGFAEIVPHEYDYINVLSGQDFPIKPASFIVDFMGRNYGTEFITCQSIQKEWTEAKVRVDKYFFMNWRVPGKHRLEKIANAILPRRKFPLAYEIVGRECWFTITTQAAGYITEFVHKHPNVVQFFKYSWVADELMMPTILYNSVFREKIRDNLTYIDWNGSSNGHPQTLTMKDAAALQQSEKLFARKFDADMDEKIIAHLERTVKAEHVYR